VSSALIEDLALAGVSGFVCKFCVLLVPHIFRHPGVPDGSHFRKYSEVGRPLSPTHLLSFFPTFSRDFHTFVNGKVSGPFVSRHNRVLLKFFVIDPPGASLARSQVCPFSVAWYGTDNYYFVSVQFSVHRFRPCGPPDNCYGASGFCLRVLFWFFFFWLLLMDSDCNLSSSVILFSVFFFFFPFPFLLYFFFFFFLSFVF